MAPRSRKEVKFKETSGRWGRAGHAEKSFLCQNAADALAGTGPHLGRRDEREGEGGARFELEDLDKGARAFRLGPLVQAALSLAGGTEVQRWAATCLGSQQRLDLCLWRSCFGLSPLAECDWLAGCHQNCLGSDDPVRLCSDQSGGRQTPWPSTDACLGPGPSIDCFL